MEIWEKNMLEAQKAVEGEMTRIRTELGNLGHTLAVLKGTGRRAARQAVPPKRGHVKTRLTKAGREAIAKAARKRWAAWRKAAKK